MPILHTWTSAKNIHNLLQTTIWTVKELLQPVVVKPEFQSLLKDWFTAEQMEQNKIDENRRADYSSSKRLQITGYKLLDPSSHLPSIVVGLLLYFFMWPYSTGRSVVSFCVTVLFQGHESVAFSFRCFHFSNISITFLLRKVLNFSSFFHFFMFNYIRNMEHRTFIGYNMQ